MLMYEGEFACLGFVSFLKKPAADKNSFIVDMLLDAGAVLYVKTNVPQTLFVCAFLCHPMCHLEDLPPLI
jgi:amidase